MQQLILRTGTVILAAGQTVIDIPLSGSGIENYEKAHLVTVDGVITTGIGIANLSFQILDPLDARPFASPINFQNLWLLNAGITWTGWIPLKTNNILRFVIDNGIINDTFIGKVIIELE